MSLDIIKIQNRRLGKNYPPFIIAEMSGNHNGSLKRAIQIVDAAAKAGVHALKLQTFTAETMTLNSRKKGFVINHSQSLWKGKTLYELYQKASTPWGWHSKIFDRCREHGLIPFSTPFDTTAVEFLESLDVPCYKIASFENIDLPLIEKVAATGKPLFISTGLASEWELEETSATARRGGCKHLIFLKCCSAYPAEPSELNLNTIPILEKKFNCLVGVSDHTLGIGAAVASIPLGAVAIEKHLTLSRKTKGLDSAFSMEPQEMKTLVQETYSAWQALGEPKFGPTKREVPSMAFRRTLYVTSDIKKGDTFSKHNVRSIRPGFGLPPKEYAKVLGRKAKRDIEKGTPLEWNLIR